MIRDLKKITVQMIAGANIATILLMLLTGYSDRINPVHHPDLSNINLIFPVFLFHAQISHIQHYVPQLEPTVLQFLVEHEFVARLEC